MVLLFSFSCFSTYRTIRIVVEPLDKNAPHLAISRLRDATSYKAVNYFEEVKEECLFSSRNMGGQCADLVLFQSHSHLYDIFLFLAQIR